MEMNPFKPLIQFYENLYQKNLNFRISQVNFNVKNSLVKEIS